MRAHGLAEANGLQQALQGRGGHRAVERMIGDGLQSRQDGRRATEVAVAARALNRMLGLGRPKYVRFA